MIDHLERLIGSDKDLATVLERSRTLLQDQETSVPAALVLIDRSANLFSEGEGSDGIAVLRTIGYHALPTKQVVQALLDLALYVDSAAVPVIEQIPSLCDKTSVELVVKSFQALLRNDRSLLVPILAALATLPLNQDMQSDVRAMTMEALSIVSASDLPAIVRALLLQVSTSSSARVASGAIRRNTAELDDGTMFPLIQVIFQFCQSSSRILSAFVADISSSRTLSAFDILLALSLLMHRRSKVAAVSMIRTAISNAEMISGIIDLFRKCPQTCESMGAHFVNFGQVLLHAPPVTFNVSDGASRVLVQTFISLASTRSEIIRFLLSSLSSSCTILSSNSAAKAILDIVQASPTALVPLFPHFMEAYHHALHFSPTALHCVCYALSVIVAHNPPLISPCIIQCQKTILSDLDHQNKIGLALAGHLIKSGNISESDRDDIMIWALRSDSHRDPQSHSALWFLDFLAYISTCLTSDEAEHILTVHLSPQLRLVSDARGTIPMLNGHPLVSAVLLWRCAFLVSTRSSTPISLEPLLDSCCSDSDPLLRIMVICIMVEKVPVSELTTKAILVCLQLHSVTTERKEQQHSDLLERCLAFPVSILTHALVSGQKLLSRTQQELLLRHLLCSRTQNGYRNDCMNVYFPDGEQEFISAVCTESDQQQDIASFLRWLIRQLPNWQDDDSLGCLCLSVKLIANAFDGSHKQAVILAMTPDLDERPNHLDALAKTYAHFLEIFEDCKEVIPALIIVGILRQLTSGLHKAKFLGTSCLQWAKTMVFTNSGDFHSDVCSVIPVSTSVMPSNVFLRHQSPVFQAESQRLLDFISGLKPSNQSFAFLHLSWTGFALAPMQSIFPFLLFVSKCTSALCQDPDLVRYRELPSLTQGSLPVFQDFLLRSCILGCCRASVDNRSRSDFCELKEFISLFITVLSQDDHDNESAVSRQRHSIRLLSVLPALIDTCVNTTSSSTSTIPKSSLGDLFCICLSLIDTIKDIAENSRRSRNHAKNRSSFKQLPALFKRLDVFETNLWRLIGSFAFECKPVDGTLCLEAFSSWSASRHDSPQSSSQVDSYAESDHEENGVQERAQQFEEPEQRRLDLEHDDLDDDEFMARFFQDSGDDDDDDDDDDAVIRPPTKRRSVPEPDLVSPPSQFAKI